MSPYNSDFRTPEGEWTDSMISVLLGTTARSLYRYLNGERYPEVRMMKRFEHMLHWSASEQVELVPMYGYDLRYSMVLRMVIEDWKVNNPRTLPSSKLRSLFESPRGNYGNYTEGQLERWVKERRL